MERGDRNTGRQDRHHLEKISHSLRAGEPFDFAGEFYDLKGVVSRPASLQAPRPVTMNAAFGAPGRNYAARHRVKPGITGWAQVNGWRGETETVEQIRKRVEHDLVYIENWSLWLDIKIIWMTIFGGFTGRNAF